MGNESQVQKNFGQRAKDYRLSSTHGDPVDLERMINLIKPAPGATALDVATGGGHTAVALAKYVNRGWWECSEMKSTLTLPARMNVIRLLMSICLEGNEFDESYCCGSICG